MKSLPNRNRILGKGEVCKKCGEVMQHRAHEAITEKQLNKPYYYSEWDVCVSKGCRMVQHYDKYKVWNKNDMATILKSKEQEDNLLELMRNF